MASEIGVNGNYAPHQGYGSLDQTQVGYGSAAGNPHSGYAQPSYSGPGPAPQSNSSSAADIPKDEVGWYFVEQYYTTLSKSPEKLYLYYNKRSQFVSGNETEKVAVSVGQKVSYIYALIYAYIGVMLTKSLTAHQRPHQGARFSGLQGPRHQRRLPGL